MSGVNSADSLPAGVAAVGGTQYRDWPVRIRSHGSRAGEMQNRDYACRCLAGRCFGREFDSRRLHQPAGAWIFRPIARVRILGPSYRLQPVAVKRNGCRKLIRNRPVSG